MWAMAPSGLGNGNCVASSKREEASGVQGALLGQKEQRSRLKHTFPAECHITNERGSSPFGMVQLTLSACPELSLFPAAPQIIPCLIWRQCSTDHPFQSERNLLLPWGAGLGACSLQVSPSPNLQSPCSALDCAGFPS